MQGKTLAQFTYQQLGFPMITVYDHPADYPDYYVARVWDGIIPQATEDFVLYDTLKECRRDIVAAGFFLPIPRSAEDDICIIASYIR